MTEQSTRAGELLPCPFDRSAFERRVAAHLNDDLNSNGRITPEGIAMIGAEAEFYARRALTPKGGDGLREALVTARAAIASLDAAALGMGFVAPHADGETGYEYPQRDELLAKIDAALSATSVQPEVSEAMADIIQRRIGPAISRDDAVSIARECLGVSP